MVDLVDCRSLGEGDIPKQFEILDSKGGKLSVQRLGAKITNLTLSGVSILGKFLRGDSKYAETHPCTPVFGPDKVGFGLPHHGPARNTLWEMVDYKYNRGLIVLQNRIQGGSYPQGMIVTQEFILQNGEFCLTTTHKNEGKELAPVNFGEHFYWSTGYGDWNNVTLNGEKIADKIQGNEVIDLKEENVVEILGHAKVLLKQKGLPYAVTWAYKNPEGGYDSTYFCLEPVEGNPKEDFFNSLESMIRPGEERQTQITLKLLFD